MNAGMTMFTLINQDENGVINAGQDLKLEFFGKRLLSF